MCCAAVYAALAKIDKGSIWVWPCCDEEDIDYQCSVFLEALESMRLIYHQYKSKEYIVCKNDKPVVGAIEDTLPFDRISLDRAFRLLLHPRQLEIDDEIASIIIHYILADDLVTCVSDVGHWIVTGERTWLSEGIGSL